VWRGGQNGEEGKLRSCYERSFALALAQGDIASIAFPAISTGIYGFPKERAAEIAVGVMREHGSRFERIVACVFDAETEVLYRRVLAA
jgi:O-acetyl-ADP-ribose deacetylase (regulator of RNase III)